MAPCILPSVRLIIREHEMRLRGGGGIWNSAERVLCVYCDLTVPKETLLLGEYGH